MELCRSVAAFTKLKDPEFQVFWDQLYSSCVWKTCYQSRSYVETWYLAYQTVFEPVLIFSTDPVRPVILALANSKQGLIVAGGRQAEYQVWLATEADPSFIHDLIELLRSRFSWHSLTFRYVPGSFPAKLLPREYAEVEELSRPLMRVSSTEELSASLKKKGNKSKINGLKKLGELVLEHIKDTSRLQIFLDEIIDMYEFRQAAVNRSTPFMSDPIKKKFVLAMAKFSNLTHCTVLRVGEKPIAAHFGRITEDSLHLGIFAYSPLYGYYSPGKIHLILLGLLLHEQGFSWLDLTPGGDQWKERFATEHDLVFAITLYSSPIRRALRSFQQTGIQHVKRALLNSGLPSQDLKSCWRLSKELRGEGIIHRTGAWIRQDATFQLYWLTRANVGATAAGDFAAKDNVRHLLNFSRFPKPAMDFEFLSTCLRRLESGEQHVYSREENDELVQYAWVSYNPPHTILPELGQVLNLPTQSALLFDFVTLDTAESLEVCLTSIIAQMFRDILLTTETKQIFLLVPENNRTLSSVAGQFGFGNQGYVLKSMRFGKKRVSASEPSLVKDSEAPSYPET